tara:strand:- start:124 stop:267 length:144 start_codon:yes stop_codon:yes gene_type:complete
MEFMDYCHSYRRVVKIMNDDVFNRMMDSIGGLLFGVGIGMVIGYGLL